MADRRWTVFARLLLAAAVVASGCSRAHYRRAADDEVNCILDNKSVAAGITPGEFRIDVDPRSRMYDKDNPDCPPQPPDDPASHVFMNCVDCKPGSPCWKHLGKTPYVENPSWETYLPHDAAGNVVLDLQGAVELALLESPAYQQNLETLYLAGLDVAFERFRFDTQFFGGTSVFYTADGRNRSGTGDSSSFLEVQPSRAGNRWRAEKFTATGGELVVGFANSLMWQFAGPDTYNSNTLIDFNLVQPLLRAGGRQRVLERLTISERALLSNVRQMERYRGGFFLNVVTGRTAGQGPQRRGGVFGGSGLEGFSGVGGGGFGQVGNNTQNQQQQAAGTSGGAGAQNAGGYIGLLQSAQVIRNQYANIAGLQDSVEQLQAAYEAGRIDRFQVDLARQALYNAQSQLLNAQTLYQNNLDVFKVQYGLPPNLPLKVTDPLLDHFNLLDAELSELQIRVTDVLTVLREGTEAARPGQTAEPGAQLPPAAGQGGLPLNENDLVRLLVEVRGLREASEQRFLVAQQDLQTLEQALPARHEVLARLATRDEVSQANLDPDLFSSQLLNQRAAAVRADLAALETRLRAAWGRLDQLAQVSMSFDERRGQLTSALQELSSSLLEMSLLQARARLDTITFEPVDLSPEEGFCIASRYRNDWMNARASLVDSWRLIAFNANDLESDLNLVFSGDISNVGDNPFRLRGTNGRLRVGAEFDAPLTRVSERNNYRQSLIEYQQARRGYYQFRDRIHRDIRLTLRQSRLDDLNFELRRAAVHVAITQVDLTRLRLSEPARPAAAGAPGQPSQPGGGGQFSSTVARDLVNAQIDLLNVQNDFLSVWVDHEVQRLQLDFDLGVMELDANGLRIEHRQPLRAFLENLPNTAPACEFPEFCAGLARVDGPVLPETSQPIDFQPGGQPTMPPPGQGMPVTPPGIQPAPTGEPNLTPPTFPGEGTVQPIRPSSEPDLRSTLRLRPEMGQPAAGGVGTEGEATPRRLPTLEQVNQ